METYRVKQKQIETEVFTIYVGGFVIHWTGLTVAMTRNNLCIIWISLVQSGHLAGVAIHFLKLWIFLCTKHILDFLLLHFIRKKLLRYVCLQLVSWRTVSWLVGNHFFPVHFICNSYWTLTLTKIADFFRNVWKHV